ncbi:RNA-dependent RNA polymerase [Baakal virus]|uniref:RNA-directed RNA polymerase L n=1 Tax=Baakal virus TaxID=2609058 RepID=A0A5C2D2R0_9VIRU|nr:RNA-dependent RNA polymerase [Baakal virus]QEO75948.1 RNA-dependent RNA polymerase [Baakal virus]
MEEELEQIFTDLNRKIERVREPAKGKELYTEILVERHNYFGRIFCREIGIPYRNDIPLVDILHQCDPLIDTISNKVPDITPDNFEFQDNILTIIDYKVAVDDHSTEYTKAKYEKAIDQIRDIVDFHIELCIVRIHPHTHQVTYTNDNYMRRFGNFQYPVDFTKFSQLMEELKQKFEDSPEFMDMIAFGDVTFTANWCDENCEELYDHPIYKEFFESMPKKYKSLFLYALNSSGYKQERWDTTLKEIRDATRSEYEDFVMSQVKSLMSYDEHYSEPSPEEINKGWEEMTKRIQDQRQLISDVNKQKPSAHFLWCEHNPDLPTNNTKKISMVSKFLQSISTVNSFAEDFKQLGKLMDITDDMIGYERYCNELKQKARANPGQVKNKKLNPRQIGNALVLWEQQFLLSAEKMGKDSKVHLLKDYFGIGKHKQFNKKSIDEIDMEKPEILDFNNKEVKLAATTMVQKSKKFLSKKSSLKAEAPVIKEFMDKIESADKETANLLTEIFSTNYWRCITDISILMKNMLSVAQYNRANTFRIATCANNCLYGLVFPSSDIKTKESTIVYCILAIHKEEENLFNPGALHSTHRIPGGFLSISKAMRLDKKRCHRIITSPGILLSVSTLLKSNNPTIDLCDVLNFSIFASLNVTKSMLSLTEPSRYMIMNSLAVSSHVREYIAEKFSPYTKTLFSVYMVDKIKNGCLKAYSQRDKIKTRDIFLTDYDITQKGVQDNRDLSSIWFPGNVNLKEYLNQIYLVFYLNPKGLHEKHHVMIDLLKTVIEIEMDQRVNTIEPWSDIPRKQTVNLPVLVHALSKNLLLDTSYAHHLRTRIETRNNLRRTFATISTFTSSKSCIKVGNFHDLKLKQTKKAKKALLGEAKRHRIANPHIVEEADRELDIKHCDYELMRKAIPDYVDIISTKVFDRLYELYKSNAITDEPVMKQIFQVMKSHKKFFFTFFNKGQKTAKDREIFVGEYEAKMCMYLVERIYKERSNFNPDEMISQPGDKKLMLLERNAEQEIRFMVERLKKRNLEIDNQIAEEKERYAHRIDRIFALQSQRYKALKLEINADMSKWSAQDVFFKYFWSIALDPILYTEEKEHILYFFCNYMNKELVIPDELICTLLDQKKPYPDDMISLITNNLNSNHFNVKKNWLQGNFNYMSSYVHSCAMSVFKDIMRRTATYIEGDIMVHSMVHSDDNQTSITLIDNRINPKQFTNYTIATFEKICLTFGCQANMKKTYLTNHIKEFVSLFNLYGEPFSIYGRFTLTAVGDCAYIGPYEDLASRISSTQTAIKHGCPASQAWLSIAISHWITYFTYNMLPGQVNDPVQEIRIPRFEIPIELGGYLNAPLSMIALVGLEAGNLHFLVQLLHKYTNPLLQREPVQIQASNLRQWDLTLLTEPELFKLKILRYLVLDAEMTNTDSMGETSEMRGRSLLTPRKFTTAGSLRKLISFDDYQALQNTEKGITTTIEYMLNNPALLVTKGETKEDYMNTILYRFNSKKFKESLSIQNPTQLFLEQILFSHKPIVDYTGINERFSNLEDSEILEENPTIKGRLTFPEAFRQIVFDLGALKINLDDLECIYNFVVLNDPLMVTCGNAHILHVIGHSQPRLGSTCALMPEFRNLRLIRHSPALVLRCYAYQRLDLPGVSIPDMERDLAHLKEFIEETKLEEKRIMRIQQNELAQGCKDLAFEIKEMTRFYQICYDFVKSTDYKVKVFILPSRCPTQTDFCAILQGSLLEDVKWRIIQHLRPVTVGGHKGRVQKPISMDYKLAREAANLLCFFADTFIDSDHRVAFLNAMVKTSTYKERPTAELIKEIENSKNRTDFLPILYRLNLLTQKDLDNYDMQKSIGRVTWNQWQSTRSLDLGKIDFQIDTDKCHLRIIGEDQQLTIAEFQLPYIDSRKICQLGYQMLNEKHGFKFENMKEVHVNENSYYITYQMKTRGKYVYKIFDSSSLMYEKRRTDDNLGRDINPIIPVCEVIPMINQYTQKTRLFELQLFNANNGYLSTVYLSFKESARMRRTELSKMQYFEGATLLMRFININALMKDTTLMNLNYDNIVNVDLARFSKLILCEGNEEDTIDDGIMCFSDEPMEQTASEIMDAIPLFTVKYKISAPTRLSYKNAIKELIQRETKIFMKTFTFIGGAFDSNQNLGYISNIVSIIDILHTNEWSTIMKNCIHICMIAANKDRQFHLFTLNEIFFINKSPASGKLDYRKIKEFILSLEDRAAVPWEEIFKNFKKKTIQMLDEKIAKIEIETDFATVLALPEDQGPISFSF